METNAVLRHAFELPDNGMDGRRLARPRHA